MYEDLHCSACIWVHVCMFTCVILRALSCVYARGYALDQARPCGFSLQHTAPQRNTLQETLQQLTAATHCSVQHTATHSQLVGFILHHTATHCNALRYTAREHCNDSLQWLTAATHGNSLQHTRRLRDLSGAAVRIITDFGCQNISNTLYALANLKIQPSDSLLNAYSYLHIYPYMHVYEYFQHFVCAGESQDTAVSLAAQGILLYTYISVYTCIFIYACMSIHICMQECVFKAIRIYVCVCVCVCARARLCVWMCICISTWILCICICIYICMSIHINVYAHVCLYTYICTDNFEDWAVQTCVYIYIRIHTWTCTHANARTHTRIHIYAHTHTHTHKYSVCKDRNIMLLRISFCFYQQALTQQACSKEAEFKPQELANILWAWATLGLDSSSRLMQVTYIGL